MNKSTLGAIIMTTAMIAGAGELSPKDAALAKIGAAIARGEQNKLAAAFTEAFDAGLTLDQAKEVVGQLYAYCGFPRALNAATTLMKASSHRGTEAQRGACARPRKPRSCPQISTYLHLCGLSSGLT